MIIRNFLLIISLLTTIAANFATAAVDVTKISSPSGLANYLTKECKHFGDIEDALNIGFFGTDGIVGLSVRY